MIRTVKVAGLNELQEKLNFDLLVQPELPASLESFERRLMRQGKGLGAKKNTIAVERRTLMAAAQSTLNTPRTTGSSWQRKNTRIVQAMAPRVFAKMAKQIEERWASSNPRGVNPGNYEGLG